VHDYSPAFRQTLASRNLANIKNASRADGERVSLISPRSKGLGDFDEAETAGFQAQVKRYGGVLSGHLGQKVWTSGAKKN